MFVLFVMRSYLIEVRGLKHETTIITQTKILSYLIEVRGLKPKICRIRSLLVVVSYRGTWVETALFSAIHGKTLSYLIEVRGLKHSECCCCKVSGRRIL